jgi:large subunit ribosomal protein L33
MAKKKKGARNKIGLTCSVCKSHNYVTEKNKINTTANLESNKYCNTCKKVTRHTERKKLH